MGPSSLHRWCGITSITTNQPTSDFQRFPAISSDFQRFPAISSYFHVENAGELQDFQIHGHRMIFQWHNSRSAQASCMLRHAEERASWNGADKNLSNKPEYLMNRVYISWDKKDYQSNHGIFMKGLHVHTTSDWQLQIFFFLHLGWLPDFRGPNCAGKPEYTREAKTEC